MGDRTSVFVHRRFERRCADHHVVFLSFVRLHQSGVLSAQHFFDTQLSSAIQVSVCSLFSFVAQLNQTFRYFSWHTALFGVLINFGVMFYLNPLYAAVSLAAMGVLVVYLIVRPNDASDDWGDVRQAIIFHQVRKYLLRLDQRQVSEYVVVVVVVNRFFVSDTFTQSITANCGVRLFCCCRRRCRRRSPRFAIT